jgi:hypothetical protein
MRARKTETPSHQQERRVLLRAMADEIYLLACEIVQLGENLSAGAADADVPQVRLLQSFDGLGQRVFAAAKILRALETAPDTLDAPVAALLEHMPCHATRTRLAAGMAGTTNIAIENTSDMEWF